jgi:hypothetical protein
MVHRAPYGTNAASATLVALNGGFGMRLLLGMILGALLLGVGVYIYDSMSTSSVANGQVNQPGRTIVNWDVAATDWEALKARLHSDWVRISSK